jgi:hypothetical protein
LTKHELPFFRSAAVKEKFVFPFLPWDIAGSERHILMVSRFFQWAGLNKKTASSIALYKFSTVYLNPFRYIIF